MNITKPIIRKIKDNETALAEFEKEIKTNEAEDAKDIIMNFPTVYIHNWPETNKYDVYVGESNNIFARTRQHYHNRIKHETWQYRMMKTDASLYIIGHEHFNKSLTLDVENRLMHYLMSVDKVHQVHNGRGNPQKHYYPSEEFEGIFQKIWTELHESDEELFPDENIVKDSAIYKASPLHKLTDEQEDAKIQILDCIALTRNKNEKQIIFIDGEAGTGKTVLNSSIFYELYCQEEEKDNTEFKCCMVVNHDEQVKVYSDIAKKLGITEKYKDVVSKASTFLNRHEDPDSVDVVFIDEAHLLFTQGNQGYSGKNQLDDIVKRAKVVAIVFDENQILRMDQYWEKQMIDRYRNKAIEQHNHITLTKQLRMQADDETLAWIDAFTKKQIINKIPHHDYEIKIFDSPEVLDLEIQKKANSEKSRLSRVIANYDWDYKKGKKPEDTSKKYWEVDVWIEDQRWHKPWNYELEQNLNKDEKKKIKEQAWAEQAHTINEVGSTYTIQGFDLNYAGVILGKSVKYRDGKIIYDPSESSNGKATKNRTMEDGTKQNFAKELLKHEVRVLMTRGVNGLYIPDIDVLNDVNIFKGIVNAFGIEWKMVEKSYNTINANLHSRKEKIVRTDFKNTVLEILDNSDTTTLSNKEIKDITVSLKIESKWETLKKSGISALPSGDATQAFDELNEILKQAGIFIVPVGELECFVKQVGGHGPDWTNKVLEKYPDLSDRVYDEIKNFIKIVCNL